MSGDHEDHLFQSVTVPGRVYVPTLQPVEQGLRNLWVAEFQLIPVAIVSGFYHDPSPLHNRGKAYSEE